MSIREFLMLVVYLIVFRGGIIIEGILPLGNEIIMMDDFYLERNFILGNLSVFEVAFT